MKKTITKNDVIQRVADFVSQDPKEVKGTVQAVFDVLSEYLVEGHRIELRNFGVFYVKKTKKRIGRNPNEPKQEIAIPAVKVPKFKPGKLLKLRVKG